MPDSRENYLLQSRLAQLVALPVSVRAGNNDMHARTGVAFLCVLASRLPVPRDVRRYPTEDQR